MCCVAGRSFLVHLYTLNRWLPRLSLQSSYHLCVFMYFFPMSLSGKRPTKHAPTKQYCTECPFTHTSSLSPHSQLPHVFLCMACMYSYMYWKKNTTQTVVDVTCHYCSMVLYASLPSRRRPD